MPTGFRLIPAHSVTTLAKALAAQISRRENPLCPETVLVMNYAQRVWLRHFLAEHLGISANLRFISPESFLQNLVSAPDTRIFERNTLAWRIFETLKRTHKPEAGTPESLRFFSGEKSDDDIFLLAHNLGDLFWRYQSFRPKMIIDWTRNATPPQPRDPDFLFEFNRQKNLWNELGFGNATPPAEAWTRQLQSNIPPEKIPPRIFAFAPSALPRLHVELLEKLAESSEVFLYYHHLSHDLWTESAEKKKRLRQRFGKRESAISENAFPPEEGNELLTAWGKAARPLAAHFIDAGLLDADSSLDQPPERDSLLHAIQREIRDNSAVPASYVPAKNDRSFRILAAPSPIREMEILRDELLLRFAENPELKPREILVMFPDLTSYIPFIRAAFENSNLPFSLADRSGIEIFPVSSAFLEILRVASGEFRLDEILSLLDRDAICSALEISEDEADSLRKILSEAEIRWGRDTESRRKGIFENTVPADTIRAHADRFARNNSWEFGLRRLALGYFFGTEDETETEDFSGISPVPGLTEAAPSVLGKLTKLLNILSALNRAFTSKETQSVPAWCDLLKSLLADELFRSDPDGAALLRNALSTVKSDAENGADDGVPATCTLSALCIALNRHDWSGSRKSGGMLRGKITFCRMQPLRNIPAKIICIAGLNDGAFPRPSDKSSLDLTAFPAVNFPGEATQWDRSKRDDDCLLFLENILAAEKELLLSYVGRNANDGQSAPPCVPLAKLRDFALKIVSEKNDTVGAPIFETLHRLHGFSPEYFSGDETLSGKYFSFSRSDYATLCGENATRERELPHFKLTNVPEKISASDLTLFLKSPADFICRKILGIESVYTSEILSSEDPSAVASALDVARFHRAFIEKNLELRASGDASNPVNAETALKNFHAKEISSGRSSALFEGEKFEEILAGKIKDFDAIEQCLPGKLFRVPAESAFAVVRAEKSRLPAGFSGLCAEFELRNLFRDSSDALFLPLFGRKNFDWRCAVECFVSAQLLSAAFPQTPFRVIYFAYDKKKPALITEKSLKNCNFSPQDLLAFFANNLSEPPLLFENLPLAEPEKTSEDDFVRAAQSEWKKSARDAAEIFIFGENAEITHEAALRRVAFPLVKTVCSAFEAAE